jgi:hypothetical protein
VGDDIHLVLDTKLDSLGLDIIPADDFPEGGSGPVDGRLNPAARDGSPSDRGGSSNVFGDI